MFSLYFMSTLCFGIKNKIYLRSIDKGDLEPSRYKTSSSKQPYYHKYPVINNADNYCRFKQPTTQHV